MMALVDYGSGSESDKSNEEFLPSSKNRFHHSPTSDGDPADCSTPLFRQDDALDDVVKPKDWEKILAEKEKRKREKKALKKRKREAKLANGTTKEHIPEKKKRAQIALFGALNANIDLDTDSDEEQVKPGPSGLAQPGARGLLGLLPPPSNMMVTKPGSTKQGMMLPSSLRAINTKKPTTIVQPEVQKALRRLSDDDDSDLEGEVTDFFGFTSKEPADKVQQFEIEPNIVPLMPSEGLEAVVGPMKPAEDEYVHPSEMYNMAGLEVEGKQKGVITDAEAHRLILEREGDFSGGGISEIVNNIQDFSVAQALGPNIHSQLLRNLTKQQHAKSTHVPIPKATDVRDLNAKRKHQITYLAQMAVSREEALQDARAESKHTKRMARQKYGF